MYVNIPAVAGERYVKYMEKSFQVQGYEPVHVKIILCVPTTYVIAEGCVVHLHVGDQQKYPLLVVTVRCPLARDFLLSSAGTESASSRELDCFSKGSVFRPASR